MAVLADSVVVLVELATVASVISAGAVFLDSVIVAAVDGVTVVVSLELLIGFAVLVVGLDGLAVAEFVALDVIGVALNRVAIIEDDVVVIVELLAVASVVSAAVVVID